MRGHQEHEKDNNDRWLLTYSDLITLLLAFFIILFSMSNIDKEKYKAVIESLGSVFGPSGTLAPGQGQGGDVNFPYFSPNASAPVYTLHSGSPEASPSATPTPAHTPHASPVATSTPDNGGVGNAIELDTMKNVQQQVEGLLAKENLQNDVSVNIRPRGLEITINSKVLFNSGSAQLTPAARAIVLKIAGILTPLADNQICVEGHTDTDPIHTSQFPSNWELSTARANTVRGLLLATNKNLDSTKMAVIGYGEWRPIVPNDTEANKAKNRRVTIVILKDDYNKSIFISPED